VEINVPQNFYRTIAGKNHVYVKSCALTVKTNMNIVLNHIIRLVKKHIYYRKIENTLPNLTDFKSFLLRTIETEENVAQNDRYVGTLSKSGSRFCDYASNVVTLCASCRPSPAPSAYGKQNRVGHTDYIGICSRANH